MFRSTPTSPFLSILTASALLMACDTATVETDAVPFAETILEDLSAYSGHEAHAHAGDYPIHVHWLAGEPEWDGLRLAVEAAARRWSHVLAPTPTAPYVFQRPVSCWVANTEDGTAMLAGFEAGDTLSPGLHLYVGIGRGGGGIWGAGAWGGECVPRDYFTWRFGLSVPHNSDYNQVSNTTPAGIVGLSAEWAQGDIYGVENEMQATRFIYGVVLHEIGHVLGIGTSERWFDGLHLVLGAKYLDAIEEWNEATDSVNSEGDTIYVEVADTTWGSYWCSDTHVPSEYVDDVCGRGRSKQARMAAFWDSPGDRAPDASFQEFLSGQTWAGNQGYFEGRLFPTTDNGFFYFTGDTTWTSYHFGSCLGPPQSSIWTRGRWRTGAGLPQDVMLGGFYRGEAGWRWYRPLITLLTANALQGWKVDPWALDWQDYGDMSDCLRMMAPADSALLFYPGEELWVGEALEAGALEAAGFIGPDKVIHDRTGNPVLRRRPF